MALALLPAKGLFARGWAGTPTRATGRGYFKATVTPKLMRLDLRFVTSVGNPNGIGYTEKSFVVEHGVGGARPA